MDIDAAIDETKAYLGLFGLDGSVGSRTPQADALDRGQHLIVEIATAAGFELSLKDLNHGAAANGFRYYTGARSRVLRLLGYLETRSRAQAIIGPQGPRLSADQLHPWVWNAARDLWSDGHYMQAVGEAAKRVELQTQNKLGRHDASGTKLFGDAFSEKPPAPGNPRLRLPDLGPEDGERWASAHAGAMHFGRGCMAGIRNWAAHDDVAVGEQQALEYIAALSVLARWVELATVDTA